jgi:DNA-binding transcriptional LysR family regulator
MNGQQMEYFRAVARLQHITRAAEQLGVTQPALSRALAKLEAELGVPLYERVGRSIRLTRYGEVFQNRVERSIREIEEGKRELADLIDPDRGKIALGFLRSLGARYVPWLVQDFRVTKPDLQFTFVQNNSAALVQLLLQGDLDLIFNAGPVEIPAISWIPLDDQELVLIVSKSHRLARRRKVMLRDVSAELFVSFKPGHAFRSLTEELCAEAGFKPTIGFEGDDSRSLPGFVAAGFGVAIVPPEYGAFPGVSALRISTPAARRTIGMAWVRDRYLVASARTFPDFVASRKPSSSKELA